MRLLLTWRPHAASGAKRIGLGVGLIPTESGRFKDAIPSACGSKADRFWIGGAPGIRGRLRDRSLPDTALWVPANPGGRLHGRKTALFQRRDSLRLRRDGSYRGSVGAPAFRGRFQGRVKTPRTVSVENGAIPSACGSGADRLRISGSHSTLRKSG